METRPILLAFNRGLVSKHALARVDMKRMALSAEEQTNWMPRTLGSMSLRPGTVNLGAVEGSGVPVYLPFVYSTTDTAAVELTALEMRIRISGAYVSRAAVSTAVTNGTFLTDLTGWTDSDEVGAASTWANGMSLEGNGSAYAARDQALTIAAPDQDVLHGLRITVARGTVELRLGTTSGGTDILSPTRLAQGVHSLAITPGTGTMHVRLRANALTGALVTGVAIESAGTLALPTPWFDLAARRRLRVEQSGDVIFVALPSSTSYQGGQWRIERRGTTSWSLVAYLPEDGPFRALNSSTTRMNVAALSGVTTLTSSIAFFESTHVGALFRLASAGQTVSSELSAEDTYTDYIRVVGVGAARVFSVVLTGTWVGTLTLQRSVSEPGDWVNVQTYTAPTNSNYDDTLANQEVYYRIGFRPGAFTSGSATATLVFAAGSIKGVCRVLTRDSSTQCTVAVLKAFGSTAPTADWWEGDWSLRRGYPSAVALHDGRLWWGGKDRVVGSVSDAFSTFDDATEGDSGPIFRSVGSGPVELINWMVSLNSLIVGGQGKEYVARASTLDEPLTPTACSLKPVGTLGSSDPQAVILDSGCVFVGRNASKVYELSLDGVSYNYSASELTSIVPEIGAAGFVKLLVQRTPDTRIHGIRSDGKVAILVFDKIEKVTCWVLYETDGAVVDGCVLPSATGDQVFYAVSRANPYDAGGTYFEEWADESLTVGGERNFLADCSTEYDGAPTTTLTGLGAHKRLSISVWGDGADLGTHLVADDGTITLATAVSKAVAGRSYTARFKSAKFSEASEIALNQKQQLHHVGLVLADTHAQGIRFGQDFDHLENMPLVEEGAAVDPDTVWESYTMDSIPIEGTWGNDSRLCLEAESPRPATVLAAIVSVTGHAK